MRSIPYCQGVWFHKPTGEYLDVYPLDQVGGIMCIWGPDVGISYSGPKDTQAVWDSDEWQGHIPVHRYDSDPTAWEFVS